MDEFKDNILDGVVYSFHFQGFPAATAHEKLAEMTGGEVFTLDKVEDLYRRIADKKFGLKKQDFSQLPEHFLQDVIEHSDWRARATLRKTCKPLRKLVDNTRLRIKSFVIDGTDGIAEITLDNYEAIYEVNITALNDLKTILTNPKLEIEEFVLESTEWNDRFDRPVLEAVTSNRLLHIESFTWDGLSPTDELIRVVRSLKPETLKSICARESEFGGLELPRALAESPQWTSAKKFESTGCRFQENDYCHLTHFEKAIVNDAGFEISFEVVMDLRNKLLTNRKLDQLKIKCDFYNHEELEEELRRLTNTNDSGWAYFVYPDSQLKLSLGVTNRYIWFRGPCYVEDGDDPDVRREARRRRLQALAG